MAQIETEKTAYTVDYPQALDFVKRQMDVLWFPDEVKSEKDVQDILVNMTEAERHGVITTLKLFTMYELIVGDEYWGDVITKMFPRPEIKRMASCFSFFELNIHAPFYAKINQALNLDTDEFYTSYLNDKELKARIKMLEAAVQPEKPFDTLVALSLIEGVVLYSSFAFLKHFQSKGKNKLLNVVRGINFSAVDENIHSEASAWLCRTLRDERGGYPTGLEKRAQKLAESVYEHECAIIDKVFEKGTIEGITATQMKHFVESRINLVFRNLGLTPLYEVNYNPISEWFYTAIGGYTSNDFFSGVGREYKRAWNASEFVWGEPA